MLTSPIKIGRLASFNTEQAQALNSIKSFCDFSVHLLFGVTGSGKTEVY